MRATRGGGGGGVGRVYWPRIRIVYLVSLVCSLTPIRRKGGRSTQRERGREGGTHSEGRRKALSLGGAVVFVVSLHATQRPFANGDSNTMGAERRGEKGDRGEILKGGKEAEEPYE